MKLSDWGTYDTKDTLAELVKPKTVVPAIRDDLIAHECAHAIVAHRLGLPVVAIDMTGLLYPVPVTLVDETVVPDGELPHVFGCFSLAGPMGESIFAQCQPQWFHDGIVARKHAEKLAPGDANAQQLLLIGWQRQARSILETDPAWLPLIDHVRRHHTITGMEFVKLVSLYDAPAWRT
jgi:hypothetical protein